MRHSYVLFKACRVEGFNGIDFANSFVWGVQTVKTMAVPGCGPTTADSSAAACVAKDVDANIDDTVVTCSSVKEWYIECSCPDTRK